VLAAQPETSRNAPIKENGMIDAARNIFDEDVAG